MSRPATRILIVLGLAVSSFAVGVQAQSHDIDLFTAGSHASDGLVGEEGALTVRC